MLSSSISSSDRRFIYKLVVFCGILVALDTGVGAILRHYYFTQNAGLAARTTHALERTTDDVVILGSSRAQSNYVPSVLAAALGRTCYNAGRDGESVLYSQAIQRGILARHRPAAFVLDLIPIDFYKSAGHYEYLSALLPYYRAHPEIRPIVELRSRWERVKLLSGIYPFNSLPLQILRYNIKKGSVGDGHVPLHGELKLPVVPKDLTPPKWVASGRLDPTMLDSLENLLAECREAEVRLVVVVSPVYQGVLFGPEGMAAALEVLDRGRCEIWDYSNCPEIVNDPTLFRDVGHLNGKGARIFSEMLSTRLSSYMTEAGLDLPAQR